MNLPNNILKYVLFNYLDLDSASKVSQVLNYDTDEHIWEKKAKQYNLKKKKKSQTFKEVCDQELQKLCQACLKYKGKFSNLHNILLCNICKDSPDYINICKSLAKTKYFLTDADLTDLKSTKVKNPHYKSGPPMTLFCEKDIINIFCAKYEIETAEIPTQLTALEDRKEQASIKMAEARRRARAIRKEKLTEALAEYKLTIRTDSKLCQGYISGNIKESEWPISSIVQRMCHMKYLFDYCNMSQCITQAYQEQEEEWEAGYKPDVPIFDHAEDIALRKHGPYPEQFPWMITTKPQSVKQSVKQPTKKLVIGGNLDTYNRQQTTIQYAEQIRLFDTLSQKI